MEEIKIKINCNGKMCGLCGFRELFPSEFCIVFHKYTENGHRLDECIKATLEV